MRSTSSTCSCASRSSSVTSRAASASRAGSAASVRTRRWSSSRKGVAHVGAAPTRRRHRPGDGRRLDLRLWPYRHQRHQLRHQAGPRPGCRRDDDRRSDFGRDRVSDDRRAGRRGSRGHLDPQGLRVGRHRHAHPVLGGEPHPGQCLPGVCRRGRGPAGTRSVVCSSRRGGHGRRDRFRAGEAQPQDGARVPRLRGRPRSGP